MYAEDAGTKPPTVYLCECKQWKNRVPKAVVHSMRTVVSDYGANWGFIISRSGFQAGAYKAANKSNVKLLTWKEFQDLFLERWITNYMVPRLQMEAGALVEYTEPFNSRIFRKANLFDQYKEKRFVELREKYGDLAFFCLPLWLYSFKDSRTLNLPLRHVSDSMSRLSNLPPDVLDAESYRNLVDSLCEHAREGVAEFDELFGGSA